MAIYVIVNKIIYEELIMKKTAVAAAILLATGVSGAVSAATTHTMTDGTFDFYNATGALSAQYPTGDSHKKVQGAFDLMNGTGSFTSSVPFSGVTWVADINAMSFHSSAFGGTSTAPESFSYDWITESWFIGGAAVTCRIAGSIDNCVDENASGGLFLGSTNTADDGSGYNYELGPGGFAAHVFFDWSVNPDIPVLAALQITSGNPFTGPATVVSIDTDAAADTAAGRPDTPGTAMLTPPFPGQTPAFGGIITPVSPIPVPAAVWLFGSGLLGLVGVARRRKTA